MAIRVAIVGGGIAGLTLGAGLDSRRFEVTIYEAQPERATVGSALGLWAPATKVLGRLGALPESSTRARHGALFRMDGRPILRVRGPGPTLVARPALLAALDAAVPVGVRRVTAQVSDPGEIDADVVVGADGVRSRVRGLVDPAAGERVETPYLALRGLHPSPPAPRTIGEYWGGARLFGIAPMAGQRTYWFSTHRSALTEPLDRGEVLDEARARFADAAPVVRDLLGSGAADALPTQLWVAPPMRRYVRDRYVVIGDAAHAMTPNLGRGACSAIVDAATLAQALNAGRDVRWWQARRLPATQAARWGSGLMMRWALSTSRG